MAKKLSPHVKCTVNINTRIRRKKIVISSGYFVIFKVLEVYVFDDSDPEPTACMGKAKIPLIALANDKAIKGTFEVRKVRLRTRFVLCFSM